MRKRSSILAFLFLCICCIASAQSLSEKQRRRDALERDIAILQKQLSGTASRSAEAISSLNLIQAQKASRQKLVQESDNLINTYNDRIRDLQSEINRQQKALDTLQAHYSRLVMGAYKNRDVKVWYMYILASENIGQAFRRFGYFKSLSSQINTQARKIEQFKAELSEKKANLVSVKAQAQAERAERARELGRIKTNEKAQQKIVDKLKRDKKSYQASLKAKKAEKQALDRQIEKMLKNATGKEKSGKAASPENIKLSKDFEGNRGKLPWPVDGPVAEHYGAYQNKELKLSLFNNGINIACEEGSDVKAVFDGVVSNIMIAPGYGQCILIQHGSYYTTYCKVKNASVHPGEKVQTGQKIGDVATIMGKTQLYFLIFKGKYLDPERWLRPR